MKTKRYTLSFNEISKDDLAIVGGKGANLGEMARAGFPIPTGFCITTRAFKAFIQTSDKMDDYFAQLNALQSDDYTALQTIGREIREHLTSLRIPEQLREQIVSTWYEAGEQYTYAVRSSATAEDLPTASFAGQQDTYLNIKGEESLLMHVRKCWASLFTDRAISYRTKNGFNHKDVYLSVVVQRMVKPEISGILFSSDPVTGNRKVTSIDASFGLGEAIVSGQVTADLYKVKDGEIITKQIGRKEIAIYSLPEGGTKTRRLSLEQQGQQVMTHEQIINAAKLGREIEKHFGKPQDIEFCLEKGTLYIVQSRPITSLFPLPDVAMDPLKVFFSFGHPQMMTHAMKPLALSVWRTVFPFGKEEPQLESKVMLIAGGRLYIDPSELLRLKGPRQVFPKIIRNADDRIARALAEVTNRPDFKKKHANPQTFKKVSKLLPVGTKIIRNLWFKDLDTAVSEINDAMKERLAASKQALSEVNGAARIRFIQQDLGHTFTFLFHHVVHYLYAGFISGFVVKKRAKEWLGNEEIYHTISKGLRGNVTSEMGMQIGDLADIARENKALIAYLEQAKDDSFYEQVAEVEGSERFAAAFHEFMERYGMRCAGEIDLTLPRWREKPTLIVSSILGHIKSVEPGEHRRRLKANQQEAEEAAESFITEVRSMRGGKHKAKSLKRWIQMYMDLGGLREHPKFLLIQLFDLYKEAIKEEADKLVAKGIISQCDEVYYFNLEELAQLIEGSLQKPQQLIQERREQHKWNQKLIPPRVMTSEGEVVTGDRKDIEAPPGSYVGTPVSAGIVEGRARIVLRAEEASLEKGDILVAPHTDPGWTPLFQSAKALVTEVGGMMTHGAVVAREYGIPAVVGVEGATKEIKEGQRIRVNGSKGYIEILED
ncbi:phosphoenolpyruvate synthase [Bacillus tianshenii]|nr:phosphoenolpyruvate synthase [Bacillus tianshenii]